MAKKRSRLAWGEGSVTERNGRWQAQWRDGTQNRGKTFGSREEAEDHLRDIARDKRRGVYVPPSELTVREMIADYLERNHDDWSGNTYFSYKQRAETLIDKQIGGIKVGELTTPQVQHWADTMRRRGSAPSTIAGARTVLSGAFKQAVRLGILPTNPVTGITTPTIRKTERITWSDDEIRAALRTVRDDPMWHALYRLVLTTGMRPGEMRSLRWGDVDLQRQAVTIKISMTRTAEGRVTVGKETKTHTYRRVLIPPSTVEALKTWRDAQKIIDVAGYVFTGKAGQPLGPTRWKTYHWKLCQTAGVRRTTLNEMRHTYATNELAAGTPAKVVSIRMGHSSTKITLDTYMHVTDEMQDAAVEAMEKRLG